MSVVASDPTADLNVPLTTCLVLWRRAGVTCPNPIAEVAVCTNAPGFLPMCTAHAEHFKKINPNATVRWLSPADFDAERAAGLYR